MKKRLTILISVFAVLSLLLTGCLGNGGNRNEEYISDSVRIITLGEGEDADITLEYIKGENMYSIPFFEEYRPSLDWLHEHVSYDERILSWWDNGHMIQGYARRQPIVFTPCDEIEDITPEGSWNQQKLGELSDCTVLTNIAYAFLADSTVVTRSILNKLGSRWVYVTKADKYKTAGMAKLLGESVDAYVEEGNTIKSNVLHKALFQMTSAVEISGFKLQYADDYAAIYEMPLE